MIFLNFGYLNERNNMYCNVLNFFELIEHPQFEFLISATRGERANKNSLYNASFSLLLSEQLKIYLKNGTE
jgi:hypothetical protein